MRLGAKIATATVLLVLIASGAALWFLVFNEKSLTQIVSPKEVLVPKDADQGQRAGAQGTAAPARAVQPVWRVNCSDGQAGLDCRAVQTIFIKKTGQRFLTVVVRMPPDTKKAVMLIQAPLRTYLPAGVALQFGQDAARTLPFQNCNRLGCVATYAVTEAEIAGMLNGADLTITIQTRQKRPITLTVPAGDFPEAYAKMK